MSTVASGNGPWSLDGGSYTVPALSACSVDSRRRIISVTESSIAALSSSFKVFRRPLCRLQICAWLPRTHVKPNRPYPRFALVNLRIHFNRSPCVRLLSTLLDLFFRKRNRARYHQASPFCYLAPFLVYLYKKLLQRAICGRRRFDPKESDLPHAVLTRHWLDGPIEPFHRTFHGLKLSHDDNRADDRCLCARPTAAYASFQFKTSPRWLQRCQS